MAADIDEFIRNQKIRMARQKSESQPAPPQQPIRQQDHVGAILREEDKDAIPFSIQKDEPHPDDVVAKGPSNEERKAAIDGRFGGSAIPGLGEREGRTRQAASERNREYNAYRAAAEEHRSRVGPVIRRSGLPGPAPGMVPPSMPPPAVVNQQQQQTVKQAAQRHPQAPFSYPAPPQRGSRPDFGNHANVAPGKGPELDRKLEQLEKTVAELRKQVERQRPPPQAWPDPDYSKLLASKRLQEASLRKLDDPELFALGAASAEKERQLEPSPDDPRWESHEGSQPTGLHVGSEERVSAKTRRQGTYREQLQKQMQEQHEKKQRERAERLSEGHPLSQRAPYSRIPANVATSPQQTTLGSEPLTSLAKYITNTPADDAYFYYASRDPLDVGTDGGDDDSRPSAKTKPKRQVTGQSITSTNSTRNREPPGGAMALQGGEGKEAERQKKAQYAQELQRQMAEVAAEKERRRKEQAEYDRKKDEEIANYHLFQSRGGGGGEPIKMDGQVVTDLRAHRRQGGTTPRTPGAPPAPPAISARAPSGTELKLQFRDMGGLRASVEDGSASQRTPRQQVNVHGEVTHARGGHGVFGQPRTDEEKQKIDHYKDELRRQIEDNQKKKEEQKRRDKIEEEKEQKRAEEQLMRIKAEYDEELRKKQEKIEATKQKNEEMWKEAEEKRKREMEQRKRRVTPPAARAQSPKEKPQRPPASPPIPTVSRQQKTHSTGRTSARPPSGLSSRRESQPEVLRQLEKMKRELESEKIRVEDALKMPPPLPPAPRYEAIPVSGRSGRLSRTSEVDVFELARQDRSGPVPRPRADPPSQELLREFRNLKLRESEVGLGVRTEHPCTPRTSDQLEVQQNTYLRQQEELFADLTHRPIPPTRFHSPRSPANQQTVKSRGTESDLEVASVYSFDVDEVKKRTEERMRRLSRLNADQVSMQDQDEVLDRFMRQRTHVTNESERHQDRPSSMRNRPQSPSNGPPKPSPRGDARAARDMSAIAGIKVNSHDGWEDDQTPAPGAPTPLDDSWLNPTRHR